MSRAKSNKNLILIITVVTLLILLYYFISKDTDKQTVNKKPQNILDNVLTNIVAPKKPNKKQIQHSFKSEQVEIEQPLMLDENDYRPFELDKI